MRRLLLAAAMMAGAHGAMAADLPDLPFLRGSLSDVPSIRPNWQGFYVGGQAGYGVSDMNFTNATRDITSRLLVNTAIETDGQVSSWPLLGKTSVHGHGFGGFVGYNSQWDDIVLGIEANYMHGNFGGSDSDSMARIFSSSNGYTNDVLYTADAAIKVKDIGSTRLRAGYAFGSFLPYVFGGVALGQGDIVKTATVSGMQSNPSAPVGFQNVPFSLSATEAQNGHFLYGYGGGLGIDMMLVGGLFVRAEWEYLKFAAPINTAVSTVRGGLGYKF